MVEGRGLTFDRICILSKEMLLRSWNSAELECLPPNRPRGPNGKSQSALAIDAHERRRDFLNEAEIAALLDGANEFIPI
jgi:hypothetical protein